MLTPPETTRLSDRIERELEDLIASGEFSVGSRLPGERSLMLRLSASRPVIREAITRLESRGLLRVYPSKGTFVTGTPEWGIKAQWQSWVAKDRGKVLALLEVRECLEIRAAALAAERADDGQVAELRLAHMCFEQQVERGSVADISHWDKMFHHQLAVCSGNDVLASFIQNANDTIVTQRRSLLATPGVAQRSLEEHARILEAIERRDPEAATAAVRTHIASSRDAARALLPG
jgi:GntR family transcriptional repressor for pyruvate dehydrogenase complex